MTQNSAPPVSLETRRTIVARPVDKDTVLTLVGAGDRTRGPWPFITGIPNLNCRHWRGHPPNTCRSQDGPLEL